MPHCCAAGSYNRLMRSCSKFSRIRLAFIAAAITSTAAWSQSESPAAPESAASEPAASAAQAEAAPQRGGEPAIRRSSVEDDNLRVDELRVRGETKRITVQGKRGGPTSYEIVPAEGGRDPSSNAKGSAGQRVWQVFSF
jgi:hypothetical protein